MGTGPTETRRDAPRRSLPRAGSLTLVAIAAGWVALRVWMFWPARHGVGASTYGDAAEYLRVARMPLLSLSFFTAQKPFGLPLFLKLLGRHQELVVWAQLLISLASWLFLAIVVARQPTGRVAARVAFAAVLVLGAATEVAQWDAVLLTESLTISAFVVLVALALLVLERPSAGRLLAAAGVAVFFTGVRDTNAAVAAVLLVCVAAAVLASRRRRAAAALVVTALGCLLLVAATTPERRWQILVADQIARRVTASPAELAYFRAHGMPYRADLRRVLFVDATFPDPMGNLEHDARLAAFTPWFRLHAQRTYELYLLTHPGDSLAEPGKRLPLLLSSAGLSAYRPPAFGAPPALLERVAYPAGGGNVLGWAAAVCGLLLLGLLRRVARRSWTVPAALLALAPLVAILTWDGEPREIPRHALIAGVSLRLGLVLGALLAGERLLSVLAARRRSFATGPKASAAADAW